MMMAALAVFTVTGNASVQPAIGLGSVLVVAGLVAYTINAIRNGAQAAPARPPAQGILG